jgi:tetratricopeptide (TPR) repeat protein
MSPAPSRAVPWVCLSLAVLTAITFYPVAKCGFVNWDDMEHVARNPDMISPTAHALQRYWAKPYFGLWAPVTYTAWLATAAISNGSEKTPDPFAFHLLNLMIHAGAVVLVFLIVRRLVPDIWPAAAGAAVFAVHPIQVEAVAWVSASRDLLAGTFSLLAIWIYLRAGIRNQIIATAVFALALQSKPTAAVAPLILATILGRQSRFHIRWLALWLVMAAAVLIVALLVQPSGDVYHPPIWGRPIVALDAIAFYVSKLVVPFHFLIDYGRSPDWLMAHPTAWWPAGLAALGGLLILAARKPILCIVAAVTLAGLPPMLGLVPFGFQYYSTVADRYMYLAMLGVAVAIAAIVAAIPRTAWIPVAVIVLCLVFLSNRQARIWRNTASLCDNTLTTNPGSVAALRILSFESLEKGNWQAALRFNDRALQTKPDDPLLIFDRANALRDGGHLTEAANDYAISLLHRPFDPQLRNDFAVVLAGLGDDAQSERQFAEVLRQAPDYAEARANWATHLAVTGHRDQALTEFRRALKDDPNCVAAQRGIQMLEMKSK